MYYGKIPTDATFFAQLFPFAAFCRAMRMRSVQLFAFVVDVMNKTKKNQNSVTVIHIRKRVRKFFTDFFSMFFFFLTIFFFFADMLFLFYFHFVISNVRKMLEAVMKRTQNFRRMCVQNKRALVCSSHADADKEKILTSHNIFSLSFLFFCFIAMMQAIKCLKENTKKIKREKKARKRE